MNFKNTQIEIIMAKKIYNTFFILLLGMHLSFAQETALDFTITDVHGDEHTLYEDYLDQGKTVVIDLFFADCPPCQELAPKLQILYEEWGEGQYDVEFIGLSTDELGFDDNERLLQYDQAFGTTYPSAGNEGGGPEAADPFRDNYYGYFKGYPTVSVIGPDGLVLYGVGLGSTQQTADDVEAAIIETGARHPSEITSVEDVIPVFDELMIYPNPVRDFASVNFTLNEKADINIHVFDMLGQSTMEVFRGNKYPGYHQVDFDPSILPSGTYFVRITANDSIQTTRLVKLNSHP